MRLHCHYCGQPVSNEVPETTVFRAVAKCPECVKAESIGNLPDTTPAVPGSRMVSLERVIQIVDKWAGYESPSVGDLRGLLYREWPKGAKR